MHDLTVAVGTYKHPDLLLDCLVTLRYYTKCTGNVLVIDGAEAEEDQKKVDEVVSSAGIGTVVHLGENRRAMGAFNEGLARADTRFFCFLHDDACFVPGGEGFWDNLIEVASYPRVGMVGPAVSNCTGIQHFMRVDLPTLVRGWYLYGACMLFPTDYIWELGGLDESISPCDDVELAVRVRKTGKEIIIDRRCFLLHQRHQTYKETRAAKGDPWRLEDMFNKIVRMHGLRDTLEPMFREPLWDSILCTSVTWEEVQRRLSHHGCEEWTL